jgi:ubiquinone/menaquinone biosynthesis C-methylase UbiE
VTAVVDPLTQKVIDANIAIHSRLADQYQELEPHYRQENLAKVEHRLVRLVHETNASSLLDLGCGTGFIIDIAKRHVSSIVGVDITQAMLDKINRSGPARIELVNHDTGTYQVPPGAFQLVTAYSFLHHLADLTPTFRTASVALQPGGKFYADLDPNFYYWHAISQLERGSSSYHPLVRREIEAVHYKDEEVETRFGVSREVFQHAEFGKEITGGFKEEVLQDKLQRAGFSDVVFHYHWFLGEGFHINTGRKPRGELLLEAGLINDVLQLALPVSRHLFKYLGFVATK